MADGMTDFDATRRLFDLPEGVSAHGVSHRRAERDSHATAES